MESPTVVTLRNNWKSLGISEYGYWREMNKGLTRQTRLFVFRKRLVSAILDLMCGSGRCNHYGSRKLTSDIDITISSNDIVSDLGVLETIRTFLKLVFADETLFRNRGHFSVRLACDFFDINFYLSNFAIPRPKHDKHDYASYYTTSDLNSQLKYAFYEYKHKSRNFNLDKYSSLAIYIKELLNQPFSQETSDRVVEAISKLSLYETECYHTQGAFIHVVLMKQRGLKLKNVPDEVFLVSAVENLCFAYLHPGSRQKYLKRVIDATARLESPPDVLYRINLTSNKTSIKAALDALWSWKQISRQSKWTVTSK